MVRVANGSAIHHFSLFHSRPSSPSASDAAVYDAACVAALDAAEKSSGHMPPPPPAPARRQQKRRAAAPPKVPHPWERKTPCTCMSVAEFDKLILKYTSF
jgi:hypothetical protein